MEMDDELTPGFRRWRDAEASGTDEEADTAFGTVFRSVVEEGRAPVAFTTRTMQAISTEAARDAVRAVRTRRAAIAASVVGLAAAAYFGAGYAFSAMGTMSMAIFNLLVGAVVNIAAGVQAGGDVWSLLGSLGHAASAFVADPKVTLVLLVLQGLALAALVALQRLLGSDGESWK
jgi:hypothetical protein